MVIYGVYIYTVIYGVCIQSWLTPCEAYPRLVRKASQIKW